MTDQTTLQSLTKYWNERIPEFTPRPYQLAAWLKTWRLEAIKQSVRITARWIKRHDNIDDEDIQAYFVATTSGIDADIDDFERMEALNEPQA